MKFKLAKKINLSLALLMTMAIPGSCTAATNPTTVQTQYENSSEDFPNPERGFYKSIDPSYLENNKLAPPLQVSELQELRKNGRSTVRKYYLLSEFRDKPISQSYLDILSNDFKTARKAGIKLIIRFTYNWSDGVGAPDDRDAPREIVLAHLDQLKPILRANYDVIAYMEAGLIGYWGEWHGSMNGLDNSENRKAVLLKILSILPKQRMVAVRVPRFKTDAFNSNSLTPEEAFNASDRARTGYHNDAFRTNIDDAGTYNSTDPASVDQQKTWLNLDTKYVVQGGEPAWASNPPEYDDCPGALTDFARMHWSGMNANQPFAGNVYQGWKDQGCMDQIKQRLGYRFRLINSYTPDKVKPSGTFSMKFQVTNDGWASPYNPRSLEIILRNSQTGQQYYLPVPESVRMWMPGETKTVNIIGGIPANIPYGKYQVLLNLPDPTSNLYRRPEYSIRLANQNVWEASTGYNSLGTSVIVDPNAAGNSYSGNQFFKSRYAGVSKIWR